MVGISRQPGDEGVIRATEAIAPCSWQAGPWVLAATILGSSMAFIDGTAITVALPAIQDSLGATAVDAQWVLAAYTLSLAALILMGGDFRPTSQQVEVKKELEDRLRRHGTDLDGLLSQQVGAFNDLLRQRNLPTIVTRLPER